MGNPGAMVMPRSFLPMIPEDEDRRFRRILAWALLVAVVAGVVMPWLPLPELTREQQEVIPPRLAKVLLERQTQQRPERKVEAPLPKQSEPEPAPTPAPEAEPKAAPEARKDVRERVSKVGLLAMRDELARLRESPVLEKLTKPQRKLARDGAEAAESQRSLITQKVSEGSGGIDTRRLSRATGGAALAEHQLTQVKSDLAEGTPGGEARLNMRTQEEVQLVFQKHKGSFDFLYNKALRKDPGLRGRVMFEITIAPSGEVVSCRILSSELHTPALEEKFLIKIKSFDFGAKDVDTTVVTYWIDFLQ